MSVIIKTQRYLLLTSMPNLTFCHSVLIHYILTQTIKTLKGLIWELWMVIKSSYADLQNNKLESKLK
jgi:hypothetical protein